MADLVSIRPSPQNAAPPVALQPTHTRYWAIDFAVALGRTWSCGYMVKHTGNWNLAFNVTACAYVLGAFCWLGMDPVTPLEEQGKRKA